MTQRTKIGIIVGETLGTLTLTLAVLSQINARGVILASPWFVAGVAGATLGLLVLTIGKTTGAHVNPAITLGLWTLKKIETSTAIVYLASQILGAALALRLFQYFINDVLSSSAGIFDWRVFTAEMVGAIIFSFGVASAVTNKKEGLEAAVMVGGSLALGAIVASTAANGILNPAVALGVNSWSKVYVAAPILGSLLGMNLYAMFFAPIESPTRAGSLSSLKNKLRLPTKTKSKKKKSKK
jgi:glycerol uptake facilitator-like aquaporin